MRRFTTSCAALLIAVFAILGTPSSAAVPPAAMSSVAMSTPDTWCSARAAGSPIVDVLGDSISAGDSVADPARRWHALLGAALRSDGAPGTQVWTGGAIPGSATADYVSGAKYSNHIEFTIHHPDLITLAWGTNDWAGNIPVAQFKSQYQQIIDRIRVLSPGSKLLIIHMPWVYNTALTSTHGDQADYRDAERQLAAENGASYFGSEFAYPGDDYYLEATPDRIHLNANGQNTLFASVLGYLAGSCS